MFVATSGLKIHTLLLKAFIVRSMCWKYIFAQANSKVNKAK